MFNLYICEQINKIILYDLKKIKYNFKDKLLCFNSESCYTIVFSFHFAFSIVLIMFVQSETLTRK